MAAVTFRQISIHRNASAERTAYEVVDDAVLPGWHEADCGAAKAFGESWRHARRSLILFVTGVVARMERNIPLNVDHTEFGQITYDLNRTVWWDTRLF